MTRRKTTREIASALVPSPRTMQRHTTNLYAKINLRNRAEAAAFALKGRSMLKIVRSPAVNRVLFGLVVAAGLLTASLAILSATSLYGYGADGAVRHKLASALNNQESLPQSKAELGRALFFDRRLSGDASTSCSTCHVPELAWTDGEALSKGYSRNTLYFRNTPTVINAAKMPLFDWDGRFAAGDFNTLIRDHIAEAHFMNLDGRLLVERMKQIPEYDAAFGELFGSEVSYGKVLGSLAAFLETLNSQDHPYLEYAAGNDSALSSKALSGLALFEGNAGCSQCHGGELLSDGELYALGVPDNQDIFQEPLRHITFRRFFRGFGVSEYVTMRSDPGLYALTLRETDRGKFRTPSLLEVAHTAPYMHNGELASLEDVVRFYNDGGGANPNKDSRIRPLGLSGDEISDLVAFLESLGSRDMPTVDEPAPPPYQPRTLGAN
ncbi:MAG: photosynthetic protein synthase I [Chloroflexi bacterium]|nr:photosynthetic protein synthase I [Chloroflexota bacterium]